MYGIKISHHNTIHLFCSYWIYVKVFVQLKIIIHEQWYIPTHQKNWIDRKKILWVWTQNSKDYAAGCCEGLRPSTNLGAQHPMDLEAALAAEENIEIANSKTFVLSFFV